MLVSLTHFSPLSMALQNGTDDSAKGVCLPFFIIHVLSI